MPELFDVHTPEAARRAFDAAFQPAVRAERIATAAAMGRVLAAELTAPHDLPAFPRATVDGYALAAVDTHGASDGLPALLRVVGEVPMGEAATLSLVEGEAALVHTGGMIPAGADAVVMIEHTQRLPALPTQSTNLPISQSTNLPSPHSTNLPISQFTPYPIELYRAVAAGQNVIQVGEDVRRGDVLLPAGHTLRAQDIGGLLALGLTEIPVAQRPRVAILSQGDEVVPPEQEPGPGQVRDINSYTLAALAEQAGAVAQRFPIVSDDLDALRTAARAALAGADLLVMSAGSSVSVRDMTATVIGELGQPGILVHGVSIKPGKPTILAVCDGKAVFGLPGNPVSAVVVFEMFVAPAIRRSLGAAEPRRHTMSARLARNLASATGRVDVVPVRLETRDGELWAVPVLGKSNLIYTLVRAEGTVRVPLDSNGLPHGAWVEVAING